MTPAAEDLAKLERLVEAQLGLRIEPAAAARMLAQRSPGFLDRASADPAELRAVAAELTTGETYFYRHLEQLHAFRDAALRDRLGQTAEVVRVLSAGCSSGEEPYTLAMIVREHAISASARVEIEGIELNDEALARAARARYTRWSLRATPPEAEQRWFVKAGNELALVPTIRDAVTFTRANLADPEALPTSSYDIVFCRNVLMYFTEVAARAAVDRLVRALVPGGYLFLGHAELLGTPPPDVTVRESHGTFYYQRAAAPIAENARASLAWFATIHAASERVRTLTESHAPDRDAPVIAFDLPGCLAAIRARIAHDDFAGALGALDRLSSTHAGEPEVMLLRAVALTEHGDPQRVAAICDHLIRLTAHVASAHYLLAVCCESKGDLAGAARHAGLATELAPAFAMAHLRSGLIACRSGDRSLARRELGRAIDALLVEDPARLALHAGGLGRDALIRMCRTELAMLEASA